METSYNKKLFTPGPLNTSPKVRKAMTVDMGSRDPAFVAIIRQVREALLRLVNIPAAGSSYTSVLMQGSGTFAIEAALGSLIPRESKLLVLINGAYGRRILHIAQRIGHDVDYLEFDETKAVSPELVDDYLTRHPDVQYIALVHCETTTGVLNPLEEISGISSRAKKRLLVDVMSSFGGMEIDLSKYPVDILVASSNKCLQGAPGLGFVITTTQHLGAAQGQSHSPSLDLYEQWRGLEDDGQFRFTPPTHVISALHQAIEELIAEGGVKARNQRYRANHQQLMAGMSELGFEAVIEPGLQSPIISTFHIPEDTHFHFEQLYSLLAERDCLIYPGKLSEVDCFRIGTIGDLDGEDIAKLLRSIQESLTAMDVNLPHF